MSEKHILSKTFYKVSLNKIATKNNNIVFNKTFYNRNNIKNISILRTSHNTDFIYSNTFLYNSIYKNNMFKKQKYILLNKSIRQNLKDKNISNIYKDFLHQKMIINFSKYNNNVSNNNSKTNIKDNIINLNRNKSCPCLINQRLNEEIYNQYNVIEINKNYDNNLNKYKNYIIRKSLLKHFLFQKKKNYSIRNEEEKKYNSHMEKIVKLSNNFYNKNTEIKIDLYLDFLQEKIQTLKMNDYNLLKKKDNIIRDIKILLENIKEKSEYLCECLKYRNLLISLRENIQINKLPEIFTFFNKTKVNEYLKFIEDNLENYNIENKNNDNYTLPRNLFQYVKSFINKNELNNQDNQDNNKYIKYLLLKPIFFNIEEFLSKYKELQFKILQNTETYLSNFNHINSFKRQIQKLKSSIKIEKYLFLKEEILKDKLKEIKKYNEELKEKYLSYYNVIINKNRKIQIRKIEDYSKEINKDRPLEESRFFFNFITLQKTKKYKIENAYVYYFVAQNVQYFYKMLPDSFESQNNFDIKKFNECIENISNCDKLREETIKSNVLYLLSLYETSIIYFFQIYNQNLNKLHNKNEIILIKRQILTNKNYELIKFQKMLEEYLKDRTKKNIILRYNKINLIKRKNYPNYSKLIRSKSK